MCGHIIAQPGHGQVGQAEPSPWDIVQFILALRLIFCGACCLLALAIYNSDSGESEMAT